MRSNADGKPLKPFRCKRLAKTILVVLLGADIAAGQGGHPTPPPPPPGAKATKCIGRVVPQLEDITANAGIAFIHASDPSKKYIVESVSYTHLDVYKRQT